METQIEHVSEARDQLKNNLSENQYEDTIKIFNPEEKLPSLFVLLQRLCFLLTSQIFFFLKWSERVRTFKRQMLTQMQKSGVAKGAICKIRPLKFHQMLSFMIAGQLTQSERRYRSIEMLICFHFCSLLMCSLQHFSIKRDGLSDLVRPFEISVFF